MLIKRLLNPVIKLIILKIASPISPRLSKKVLKKSKFYKDKLSSSSIFSQGSWSYTQVSKDNVNNIIKIKDNFLNLSNKKVKKFTEYWTISRKKTQT